MFFLGSGKAFLNFRNTWLNRLNEAVMPFCDKGRFAIVAFVFLCYIKNSEIMDKERQ